MAHIKITFEVSLDESFLLKTTKLSGKKKVVKCQDDVCYPSREETEDDFSVCSVQAQAQSEPTQSEQDDCPDFTDMVKDVCQNIADTVSGKTGVSDFLKKAADHFTNKMTPEEKASFTECSKLFKTIISGKDLELNS